MRWLPRYVVFCAVAIFLLSAAIGQLADGGVDLREMRGARTDLRVDATIPIDDTLALVATADEAAARVEDLFARRFDRRPRIAIFATPEAFARGTSSLFGYSKDTADAIAMTYGGIFDRRTSGIAVDEETSDDGTAAVIEHELVHQMVRELSRGADLPAWLEEGIATVVAQEDRPSGEWLEEESLEGRAVAASGRTSFAELATLEGWQAAYARIGEALYDESAEAVRAMELRIGWTGVLRAIAATASGVSFADAYASGAGESLASVEGRLAASASAALLVREPLASDRDVVWVAFTGIPNADLSVRITGPRSYAVTFTVMTDALGMYRGSFGSTADRGTYVLSAAGLDAVIETDR